MVKIFTDSIHKIAYSTDASVYRQLPQGVAFPETVEELQELIAIARERRTHLIPRAAGTSIAGQVVGDGIVVDISKHFNKILEINAKERWARVEPGVVRDELNLALKPYGLFFSPETSTSNRCCIGGMLGNNSCGTHSLVYGSTRDHILEVRGLLSDGSLFNTNSREGSPLLERIYEQLEVWKNDPVTREIIGSSFPDKFIRRRNCGYAIDEAIEGKDIDLGKLLAGSEGTLALVTEIKVSLDPLPPSKALGICVHCDSLEKSFRANLVALKHGPVAVELMDGKILELGKDNPEASRNRFFINGEPAAVLIVELRGDDIEAKAEAIESELLKEGLSYCCTRIEGKDIPKAWALRKAGLGVLNGMKGDARPTGVIEDTAVAVEKSIEYFADIEKMLHRLGLECVFYGHISTGELHLRPILNLKTEEGISKFKEVAYECAKIVKKHKGSLSGEHGDGRLRGEFIPIMYGRDCYGLMLELKNCWDPDGIFNVGKITGTPGMTEWLRYTPGHPYKLAEEIGENGTAYNWKASFDECTVKGASGVNSQVHALMCSIEQCNGAGECRKSSYVGGTICPAFKVSGLDELESTRARANLLREALTRGIDGKGLEANEISKMLYSCLACKGCKGECPSNVDMAKIRAELLYQLYKKHGTPFRSYMVSRMATIENLGAIVPHIYNIAASWKPSATLIKKIVGFAPERSIPRLQTGKIELKGCGNRKVYFFLDEFTRHQDKGLAQDFIILLEGLGYQVIIPGFKESGRAAMSKGCLGLAAKMAAENVRIAKEIICDDTPLVGIEPSCILSFRDEYPDLVPPEMRKDALALAGNCLLFDEFIMREVSAGRIAASSFKNDKVEIWLHGHCHQKAIVGIEKTAAMLRLLPGATVNVIPSGCCGMAGSFGYEKEHYRTSLAIGEMVLFPAVRKAVAGTGSEAPTVVCAPGTSCRQQILDGTGVRAVHPVSLMAKWLKVASNSEYQ